MGIKNVVGFNFIENENIAQSRLDSVKNAKLIFISGGDQNKFMKVVGKGKLYKAIHEAYQNGATISGTSAGAAVMSKKMITGNQKKHAKYTGDFPTIEADNIEIGEGLGLIENIIVDQHFIKRQRLNRLLAVVSENPEEICIGIDESTAIVISGKKIRVVGDNQIIVLKNPTKSKKAKNGLLGANGLSIDIYLPDESFEIK